MTTLLDRPRTEMPVMAGRPTHVTEWVTGIVGLLAAGVGAWMYYVPTNWFLGGLVEAWPFGMLIGAGVLLAAAFGIFARKVYREDRRFTTGAIVATVLALAALAGAITFGVILLF